MLFRGSTWPRLAEGLRTDGRPCEARLFGSLASSAFSPSQGTPAAPPTRTTLAAATTTGRLPPLSYIPPPIGQPHDEPNVDPDSLRDTLEAHRQANHASLIVKIAGKGSIRQHIQVPSFVTPRERLWESQSEARAWHGRLRPAYRRLPLGRKLVKRRRATQKTRDEFLVQWAPRTETRHNRMGPWMRHMKGQGQAEPEGRLAGIEQLNLEIDAFYAYSEPNLRERRAAGQALHELTTAIRKIDENIKIDVVGSRATGLDLPMSDIDLNISSPSSSSNADAIKALLMKVSSSLSADTQYTRAFRAVTTRLRSKIPLVTGRHMRTHLEFQIQSTVDVFLSMQQTLSFIDEFPTLQKLFILLKQMLTMRGLNLGAQQGISSYPLLVMVVAALKFSEGKLDRRDAGAHLLFFLDMYSDIDFTTTAISFSPLQYVVKRHPHSSTLPQTRSAVRASDSGPVDGESTGFDTQDLDARRRFATIKPDAEFLMCLQDPANLQNDLGRAAYRIKDIQGTFIRVREKLKLDLKAWDDEEVNPQQKSLLASCVGGDYHIYEHMRHDLEASVDQIAEDL